MDARRNYTNSAAPCLRSRTINPRTPTIHLPRKGIALSLRMDGLQSRIIEPIVERLAKKWGYSKVLLRPKSLDERWSNERLREWHSKRGYKPEDRKREDMWIKVV